MVIAVLILGLMYVLPSSVNSAEEGTERPSKPEIRSLYIRSDIAFRFATTHVTSKIANQNDNETEVAFHVTLPAVAFISNFSMNIDGNIIKGVVKNRSEAQDQYKKARSLDHSAGYIASSCRGSNSFEVVVNTAAGKEVTFDLEYQEVLERSLGYYEHVINIDPGQVVRDLKTEVNIHENRPIQNVRVPPIRTQAGKVELDVTIDKFGENSYQILYQPSEETQSKGWNQGINGQFVVQYYVQRALDAGEFHVSNDGYFVHSMAPQGLPPIPKNIFFILDVSGSMIGTKLSQVKDAMFTILDDIRRDDTFNLLTFDDVLKLWKDELQEVNNETLKEAKQFILNMVANGATNIDGAISHAINFLDKQKAILEKQHPTMIIFLTDGDPTDGETDLMKILENIRSLNQGKYTLFCLGFGEDLRFRFLQQLSLQNGGIANKIYEASDAALQIKNLYREVSLPLLTDVQIKYQSLGGKVTKVIRHAYKTFFSGSELLVAGKCQKTGLSECVIRHCLNGKSVMGEIEMCSPEIWPPTSVTAQTTSRRLPETDHAQKIWAYLTIWELLYQSLRETDGTKKRKQTEEALKLSLQYQVVSPLTSMVVTLPENPDETLSESRDSVQRDSEDNDADNDSGEKRRSEGKRPSTTVAPDFTPPTPTSWTDPALGAPSLVVHIPTGMVCLGWPLMSDSAHIILKHRDLEVRVTHGARGASESVMIKTRQGISLVTPSRMLIDSKLVPWGRRYTGRSTSVAGNTATFQLQTRVRVKVHKVNETDLVVELLDASGLTYTATGILRHTHSWLLTRGRWPTYERFLLTPTVNGIKRFATSTSHPAGITCQVAEKDVFDVTRYSRRA